MTRANESRRGMLLAGLASIGFVASFWQTATKIETLKNPEAPLSCNINPIVDCGKVLENDLSAVFGVPNSMIGMSVFAVLAAFGVVMALGLKPNLWLKRIITVLSIIMFGFTAWFFGVSLYIIGKLCIFCVVIWPTTFALFVLVLGWFGRDVFPRNKLYDWKLRWFEEKPWQPIVVLYLIALILFIYRFRDYYFN